MIHRSRIRASLTSLAVCAATVGAVLQACSPAAPSNPASRATARDSAGITIVENPPLEAGETVPWTLSTAPAVSIGAIDAAEPEYELFQVRDALVDDSGRILVANGGSGEIRVYDPQGSFLERWGGEGEGPGEFRALSRLSPWPGDTIASYDAIARRLTLHSTDGAVARMLTLNQVGELERPLLSEIAPDGFLVVNANPPGVSMGQGVQTRSRAIALAAADGSEAASLGVHVVGTQVNWARSDLALSFSAPFTTQLLVAPVGDEIVISNTARIDLRYYDRTGSLERIVRVTMPLVQITAQEVAEEIERRLADMPPPLVEASREALAEVPVPEHAPQTSAVISDPTGYTWVRLERPAPPFTTEDWIVLDAAGAALGTIRTPQGLDVYEVGPDYVLGRYEDELEVEYVQLWSLVR